MGGQIWNIHVNEQFFPHYNSMIVETKGTVMAWQYFVIEARQVKQAFVQTFSLYMSYLSNLWLSEYRNNLNLLLGTGGAGMTDCK